MSRPAWYPKRTVIHTADGDFVEARCVEAEQAMAQALSEQLKARMIRVFDGAGTWHFAISGEACEQLMREALDGES